MMTFRRKLLLPALLCILSLAACGQGPAPEPPAPAPTETAAPTDAAETAGPLDGKALMAALDALDPVEGTLTLLGDEGEVDSYPAGKAICGASYLERLKNFVWEERPSRPEEESGWRMEYTAPGLCLTAFQVGDGSVPFHLVTPEGEGWFTLPYIEDSAPGANDYQADWMVYDEAFEPWYEEAKTAVRYGGAGKGAPLTAEELEWFREYTASTTLAYDYEWGGWIGGATPISCFFTSRYSDPRDMDAGEFLYYCPDEGCLVPGNEADEAEFRLAQRELHWWEDDELHPLSDLPIPVHRYSRAYINGILTQYAGVTIEEMHTDWLSELWYIPETDCFYGGASDFGPGKFHARYGEKEGDVVTLWEVAEDYTGGCDVLRLQRVGEEWHILSHQEAETE